MSKMISVASGFQYSVNIGYDLNNETKNSRFYAVYETVTGDSGCVLDFSCCARKAQASRFGTKTQLAGRTLPPMPPAGGELMVEPAQVRKLTSAQPFTPRHGARRADVCDFTR